MVHTQTYGNSDLEGLVSVLGSFTFSAHVYWSVYQALYRAGCSTSLSNLVILSGGLYLPCHQFVAITVRFAVDSVSTSLVNIKDLAVAKLLNICCCRITEHCGFLVIWYFKVQINFPCIIKSQVILLLSIPWLLLLWTVCLLFTESQFRVFLSGDDSSRLIQAVFCLILPNLHKGYILSYPNCNLMRLLDILRLA